MSDNQIQAPFTPEQVKGLNTYQVSGAMHEFTCGSPNHPKKGRRSRLKMLVAAPAGWFCPGCGTFVQYWAWNFMANGAAVNAAKAWLDKINTKSIEQKINKLATTLITEQKNEASDTNK